MQSFSARSFRLASRSRAFARPTPSIRCLATAVDAASPSTSSPAPPPPAVDANISRIVDDISKLTLLQAADLVTLLKSRLNIQEIAMPTMSAAAPAAAAEEAPVEEKPKEKTIFAVNLVKIDPATKPKVIKEVKALVPNMTLMDAKKFVESLPQQLKDNVPKEEAEKIKKALMDLGATVELA